MVFYVRLLVADDCRSVCFFQDGRIAYEISLQDMRWCSILVTALR